MSAIWLKALPYIAAVLLALGALYGAYHHGKSVKDEEWQSRWNARDAGDKQAWALAEVAEREKEQARQTSINKAVQDGQRKIDQAAADTVTARAAAGSLQRTVDDLADRLAAQGRSNSCTAAASAAASRAVLVLADVLKKSVRRNTELAETADSAIARGGVCEAAYSALQTK